VGAAPVKFAAIVFFSATAKKRPVRAARASRLSFLQKEAVIRSAALHMPKSKAKAVRKHRTPKRPPKIDVRFLNGISH
jgi:hypothetical protein